MKMYAIVALALFIPAGCLKKGQSHKVDPVLWIQSATEYQIACEQTFKLAQLRLREGLLEENKARWSAALEQTADYAHKPPAVIVDVDETLLDNSPFQATSIAENRAYSPDFWDEWVAERKAGEVPGATDFVRAAEALGVTVFYVTNRACRQRNDSETPCPQRVDTIANLEALAFPKINPDQMLLKNENGWGSEKRSRRALIAESYRIVLLVGDDLGDFIADVKGNKTPADRLTMAEKHQEMWGVRWIALPNPMYGSWLQALGDDKAKHMRGFR